MTNAMDSDLPILDPDEETAVADAPRTVLITGAAGDVGRTLSAAWADRYELIRLDRHDDPNDPDLIVADLADWDESWTALFDEADTVVFLDAETGESASWPELVRSHLDALTNVLLAAAQAGVDRVVFASAHPVTDGHRAGGTSGPIREDGPPQPITPLGASKLMGERLGRGLAAAFGLSFVALRVGHVQPGTSPPAPHSEANRTIGPSSADLVRLFTSAVEAELEEEAFVVVTDLSDLGRQGSAPSVLPREDRPRTGPDHTQERSIPIRF